MSTTVVLLCGWEVGDDRRMYYLAYGSNMDAEQMQSRCAGAEFHGAARLWDWQFRINSRGVATIVHQGDSVVCGVVWRVTAAHIRTLDRHEGVASGFYRREQLEVCVEGDDEFGETLTVEVYIAADASPGMPREGYLETVLRGAKEHGLPGWYRREIWQQWHGNPEMDAHAGLLRSLVFDAAAHRNPARRPRRREKGFGAYHWRIRHLNELLVRRDREGLLRPLLRAFHVACAGQQRTTFVTDRCSELELSFTVLQSLSEIPARRLRRGMLRGDEPRKIDRMLHRMTATPVFWFCHAFGQPRLLGIRVTRYVQQSRMRRVYLHAPGRRDAAEQAAELVRARCDVDLRIV